jgi:hypothetical protein
MTQPPHPTPAEFYGLYLPIVHLGSAPALQYAGLVQKKHGRPSEPIRSLVP